MRSREDFLKWYNRPKSIGGQFTPQEIYDYFNPPQSGDVKERARQKAIEMITYMTSYAPQEPQDTYLINHFAHCLLSFQAPSVEWPSEDEENLAYEQSHAEHCHGFIKGGSFSNAHESGWNDCSFWLRDRIEKGLK